MGYSFEGEQGTRSICQVLVDTWGKGWLPEHVLTLCFKKYWGTSLLCYPQPSGCLLAGCFPAMQRAPDVVTTEALEQLGDPPPQIA